MNGVAYLFHGGGPFMWPLLGLSILAFGLILYKIFEIVTFHKYTKRFVLFLKTKGEKFSEVFGSLNSVFSLPKQDGYLFAEEFLQIRFDRQFRILELINGIGGTAPLLGFIGTVSGMIVSFQAIANADKVSIKLIAGGISEALITTGFGLIIAVLCTLADSAFRYYLVSRTHFLEDKLRENLHGN